MAPGYVPNRAADAIDPVALCAFIGDLFSVRILSFKEFKNCVNSLFIVMPSPVLIQCLHAIFAHGGAHRRADVTPAFLLNYISFIQRKCASYRGTEILEVFIKYYSSIQAHL